MILDPQEWIGASGGVAYLNAEGRQTQGEAPAGDASLSQLQRILDDRRRLDVLRVSERDDFLLFLQSWAHWLAKRRGSGRILNTNGPARSLAGALAPHTK